MNEKQKPRQADEKLSCGPDVRLSQTQSAARVLLYGLPDETPAGSALRKICAALRIAVTEVAPYQLLQPAGLLAGCGGKPAALYFGRAPQQPVLVMAGFSSALLDELLAALRRGGVCIPLKAVLTQTNQSWSMLALMEELGREHAAMHPEKR